MSRHATPTIYANDNNALCQKARCTPYTGNPLAASTSQARRRERLFRRCFVRIAGIRRAIGAGNSSLSDTGITVDPSILTTASPRRGTSLIAANTIVAGFSYVHFGEKVILHIPAKTVTSEASLPSRTVTGITGCTSVSTANIAPFAHLPVAICTNDRVPITTGIAAILTGRKHELKENDHDQKSQKQPRSFHHNS